MVSISGSPSGAYPRRTVLCVDDNPEILQALRRELREGLDGRARIEVASSPEQAMARLEGLNPHSGELVIVVSDWMMPSVSGEQLVHEIEERWGRLPTVVLSGHLTESAFEAFSKMPQVAGILRKPWSSAELLDLLVGLLGPSGSSLAPTPLPPPVPYDPETEP